MTISNPFKKIDEIFSWMKARKRKKVTVMLAMTENLPLPFLPSPKTLIYQCPQVILILKIEKWKLYRVKVRLINLKHIYRVFSEYFTNSYQQICKNCITIKMLQSVKCRQKCSYIEKNSNLRFYNTEII